MAQTSRLLALPAEIRNQIYEYVLTSQDGTLHYRELRNRKVLKKSIFIVPPKRFPRRRAAPTLESAFNQLQYVNRQLRREAGALELKYNTLSFCSKRAKYATSIQLLSFLNSLSPGRASWPLKITPQDWNGTSPDSIFIPLTCPFKDTLETIAKVSQHCRNNPCMTVTWRLSRLRVVGPRVPSGVEPISYEHCAERAIEASYLKRPRILTALYKDTADENRAQRGYDYLLRFARVQNLYAENLVFMPMLRFDRERWQKAVHDGTFHGMYHIDKLLAQMEEWCKNGI